ncbi:IS1/IS1595 family N-terminal zinc-binding domain-containing protein [Nostoc sp.]
MAKTICQSQQLSKNGHRRGKQCYRCKDCGKQFVNSSTDYLPKDLLNDLG